METNVLHISHKTWKKCKCEFHLFVGAIARGELLNVTQTAFMLYETATETFLLSQLTTLNVAERFGSFGVMHIYSRFYAADFHIKLDPYVNFIN